MQLLRARSSRVAAAGRRSDVVHVEEKKSFGVDGTPVLLLESSEGALPLMWWRPRWEEPAACVGNRRARWP